MEDGVDVRGSMICLPNSYVLWAPKTSADITVESLRLLELVTPKIGKEGRNDVSRSLGENTVPLQEVGSCVCILYKRVRCMVRDVIDGALST